MPNLLFITRINNGHVENVICKHGFTETTEKYNKL